MPPHYAGHVTACLQGCNIHILRLFLAHDLSRPHQCDGRSDSATDVPPTTDSPSIVQSNEFAARSMPPHYGRPDSVAADSLSNDIEGTIENQEWVTDVIQFGIPSKSSNELTIGRNTKPNTKLKSWEPEYIHARAELLSRRIAHYRHFIARDIPRSHSIHGKSFIGTAELGIRIVDAGNSEAVCEGLEKVAAWNRNMLEWCPFNTQLDSIKLELYLIIACHVGDIEGVTDAPLHIVCAILNTEVDWKEMGRDSIIPKLVALINDEQMLRGKIDGAIKLACNLTMPLKQVYGLSYSGDATDVAISFSSNGKLAAVHWTGVSQTEMMEFHPIATLREVRKHIAKRCAVPMYYLRLVDEGSNPYSDRHRIAEFLTIEELPLWSASVMAEPLHLQAQPL